MKLQCHNIGVLGVGLMILTNSGIAIAGAPDPPERVLFEDGKKLMREGQFEQACAKFQQSLEISKRAATWHALAECNMKWDHPAEALVAYDAYIAAYEFLSADEKVNHADRIALAPKNREIVRARVASIIVVAPGVQSFDVFIDDRRRGTGDSIFEISPLNPGEHHVQVLIPGRPAHDVKVILHKGDHLRIEPLAPAGAKPHVTHDEHEPEKTPVVRPLTDSGVGTVVGPGVGHDEPVQGVHRARVAGFIAFGVGLAGFATGGVFTLLMMPNRETSERQCHSSGSSNIAYCSTKDATAAGNQALRYANLSTVGLGVGLAGVAAGTALLIVGRRQDQPPRVASPAISGHLQVSSSSLGVFVNGAW